MPVLSISPPFFPFSPIYNVKLGKRIGGIVKLCQTGNQQAPDNVEFSYVSSNRVAILLHFIYQGKAIIETVPVVSMEMYLLFITKSSSLSSHKQSHFGVCVAEWIRKIWLIYIICTSGVDPLKIWLTIKHNQLAIDERLVCCYLLWTGAQ